MESNLERWVHWLTPPAVREEVLGDLAERNALPRAYLRDALRTLPFVIASRLRRTLHPLTLLVLGPFLYWATFWGGTNTRFLPALLATVLVIAVLALRDVYRAPAAFARWWRAVALDIALAMAMVLLAQLAFRLLAPSLMVPAKVLLSGFPLGMLILYFLRAQMPSGFQPPAFLSASHISLEELRVEISVTQSIIRRAVRIEIGACAVVALVFLVIAFWEPAPMARQLCMLFGTAGATFTGWFMWRHARVRPIPAGLDFSSTLAAYRADMARRARISRRYFWWYLLPLLAGPAALALMQVMSKPAALRSVLMILAVLVALCSLLTQLQRAGAAKVEHRVAQLGLATEKQPQHG